MSGGFFEYRQYLMSSIADEIEQVIINNESEETDEWGSPISKGCSEETIKQFYEAIYYLKKAQVYAQRIDWLLSGDDSESAFHKRLAQDLAKIEK
jgi:hypothetical protein